MLQFFHLHKGSLELGFRALPLQFSRSPRGKNLEHVDGTGIAFHRLIIKGGDMPYDTSHSIQHRHSQVALDVPVLQTFIQRKQNLDPFLVVTHFALQNLHARRIRDIKLKVLPQLIGIPEGKRLRALLIVARCNKGITKAKCRCHVAHQRREEIISGYCGGAHDNRSERLFGAVTFGDIAHQTNDPDNAALCVTVGSEATRFPNILAFGRMLRNQSIRNLNDFSLQCSFQSRFNAAGNKARENVSGNLTQDFLCVLTRESLHIRIPQLITQLWVVDDNAFRGALHDLLIELDRLTQSTFIFLVLGNVSREREEAFWSSIRIKNGTDHNVPPSGLAGYSGREIPGTASLSPSYSFFYSGSCRLSVFPSPEINQGA